MQNDPSYQNLIEMGISPIMAEASIKKTGSNDVSTLLDWIGEHESEEAALEQWLKSPQSVQQKSQQSAPEGISHLVNAELNAEIQSLGNSKNVTEKALLLNGNNKDKALRWIDDHKYDVDFEQALIITGQQQQSNLTKQQAQAKLQELIKKAREKREKQEAESALERQKNRMKSGKEALDIKRQTQQQRMRQQMELDKIQKAKDDDYKKKLLIQMKKERCQKLGIPYVQQTEQEIKKKQTPVLSKSQLVYVQIQQVRVGNYGYPEKAKVLYDTTIIYLNNIIKNPTEPKFQRINTQNNAYQNRIANTFGGPELLQSIGFAQEGTFLVLHNPDIKQLSEIVKALQKMSNQY